MIEAYQIWPYDAIFARNHWILFKSPKSDDDRITQYFSYFSRLMSGLIRFSCFLFEWSEEVANFSPNFSSFVTDIL